MATLTNSCATSCSMPKATSTCGGPMTSKTSLAARLADRSRKIGLSSSRPMKDAAWSTESPPIPSWFRRRLSGTETSRLRHSIPAPPFTRFQAATPNLLQGFGNNNATRAQQINVSHTWTISPVVVNELRLSYFREAQGTFLHPQHTNLVTDSCSSAVSSICFTGTTDVPGVIPSDPKIGITPGLGPKREGVPFISIAGGFTIGNDFEGELPQKGNTYQISDSLTKVMGRHTTKFGVDLRNQRFFQTLFFDPNGDYSYFGGGLNDPIALDVNGNQNLFPNYLLGLPDSYLQGSAQSEDVRGNSIYLFAQDSWKIRGNLPLNYGLRWEYNQPLYDAGLRYQTFRPGQATTTYPCQLTAASQANLGYPDTNCNPGGKVW